jgi:hypothetical protein
MRILLRNIQLYQSRWEDSAEAEMKKVKDRSDARWAKALPIIEADAKKGSLLFPGLQSLEICLKRKIPAFPGAEGGGKFSFGGRGGKSICCYQFE